MKTQSKKVVVMAGLVPAIHAFTRSQDVDARQMMSGLPDIIKFPIHKSAVADLCAGHDAGA
ncbi:MAG: hypothetical protein K2P86_11755 [Xanthobacteraceae bacterium]|nr:hypothetical protein [Xanthobacteraceae bacterium]